MGGNATFFRKLEGKDAAMKLAQKSETSNIEGDARVLITTLATPGQ
jgi:hypothetical protein